MKNRTAIAFALILAASAWQHASGQDQYQRPPENLAQLVDAPVTPAISVSPDGQVLLMMHRPSLPSIEELAQPELRLAGMRINPVISGPSRTGHYVSLGLVRLGEEAERTVSGHPSDGRIRNVRFSPDGSRVAYTVDTWDRIDLYVAEVESAKSRRLLDAAVNDAASGAPYQWVPDSGSLVVLTVPAGRGPMPASPSAPAGPVIQENLGEMAPARTYQDLLANPHDEALFRHFAQSEVVQVMMDGTVREMGQPGLVTDARPSPDGKYVLVEHLHEPFSYLVPAYRFAHSLTVYELGGGPLREVARLPLAENVPTAFGSVPAGPRSMAWRADEPSTLVWVEALDGGDARAEVPYRDEVFMLPSPFDGTPVSLVTLPLRYGGITWGDESTALVRESWWSTRKSRTYVVNPGSPGAEPRTLFDLSTEDRYADPGFPLTRPTGYGTSVLRLDGRAIYLSGQGASPEGNRPFLRRMDLETEEVEELFRSSAPHYERPVSLLDETRLLTLRESAAEPPNYVVRDLRDGSVQAATYFEHPYPDLAAIQKESLQYAREDGVPLSATLYLPPGYDAGRDGPLPGLVWAYPREFKDADAAGQRTDSPYRFKTVSYWGAIPYVMRGYAVLDNASMPVIGEGDAEPNDSFREQLVANAAAAIEVGVRRGVLDPERVAIGGHSYGAFMTANLLAHSDLFRAGIARSGAYNRTLTPFGFQREERLFWEAPEIYYYMSPFMHADKVDEPILLIHGEADNNSGTFPLQSRRYFSALKGLGKTARLVMLPHESHGYRARESILHMLWETDRWLEIYVKHATPRMRVEEPSGP